MNPITSSKRGILFLRGNTIDIYEPSVPKIVSLLLPNDTYSDMEIINQENLITLVQNVLSANKFPATQFFLILNAPLFIKEFQTAKQEQTDAAIETYLESVPFESVLSKQLITAKGVTIIAANGTLYESLQKAFISANCSIACITPLFSLDAKINKESALTQPLAIHLYNNLQSIRQNAFSSVKQKFHLEYEFAPIPEKPKQKSTLPLLIPIFAVLIIVLIFVYMQSQKSTQPPVSTTPTSIPLLNTQPAQTTSP